MRATRNNDIGQTGRTELAGVGGRPNDDVGVGRGDHGRAPVGADAARRFREGTRSSGKTCPSEIRRMAAATVTDGPRVPAFSFRTPCGPMQPMRLDRPASVSPSLDIQSRSVTPLPFPAQAPGAPAVLPTARLAEALAVLVSEMIDLMPGVDRDAARERIANRLDGFGRTPGGSEAAGLLRAVAEVLMRMEV